MSRGPHTPAKQLAKLSPKEMTAGVARLEKLIERVKQFDVQAVTSRPVAGLDALMAAIDECLARTFGPDTLDYDRYRYAGHFDTGPINMAYRTPIESVRAALERSKQSNIDVLAEAAQTLRDRLAESSTGEADARPVEHQPRSNKIFVVHGRDEGAREAVAHFLVKLGFQPVILNSVPSQGRTVIEKIEAEGDVGFAVVLLTPDDEGRLKGAADLDPRARQNVLLELGYFVGRLGRKRVCSFVRGKVDIPSDWSGVVYEQFDEGGGWQLKLAKELGAAGYDFDWNKLR